MQYVYIIHTLDKNPEKESFLDFFYEDEVSLFDGIEKEMNKRYKILVNRGSMKMNRKDKCISFDGMYGRGRKRERFVIHYERIQHNKSAEDKSFPRKKEAVPLRNSTQKIELWRQGGVLIALFLLLVLSQFLLYLILQ